MVASERRLGSRRVMTVLGKIPVAPKPINLPSQRSENQDIASWDTSVLGSPGGGPPPCDATESEKADARAEENTVKESESLLSRVGKALAGEDGTGNDTSLLSPCLNTSEAVDSHTKMQDLRNRDSSKSGAGKAAASMPTKSGDTDSRGGVNGSFSWSGVPPPGFEGMGHGPGPASSQNGLHGFQPSVPYRNSTKEREVIVIHMVGNGRFYGNYPVQIGYSAAPSFGNFPLQFGNFEPCFGLPGPPMLDGGSRVSPTPSREFFHDHEEGFVCYEKECSRVGHDRGRHRNGRVLGGIPDCAQRGVHEPSLSATVSALASRPSLQKHVFKNPGRTRAVDCNESVVATQRSPAKPVPEKGFMLLKKVPQRKKMLVENLQEEVGGGQGPLTEGSDGSSSPSCVLDEQNRGECSSPMTPLETPKAIEVIRGPDTQKSDCDISTTPQESSLPPENISVMNQDTSVSAQACDGGEDSVSRTCCNATCLQCKVTPVLRESTSQVNSKITVAGTTSSTLHSHFQPNKDETIGSTVKTAYVDGCKVEVKHVIFDADCCQTNALVNEEDASSNGMANAVAIRVSGIKVHREGRNKRLLEAAKTDLKVFAPTWKPKANSATKAAKGIHKLAKQMNKSVGDVCDGQRSQSAGSVDNGLGWIALKEISEAGKVVKGKSSGMAQELSMPHHIDLVIDMKASACNAKCFRCKAETASHGGYKGQVHGKTVVQECSTTRECCSTTMEEECLTPIERTTFVDGCKVEVKHVIFDADCHAKDKSSVETLTVTSAATGLNATDPESFAWKSTQQKTRTWKLIRGTKVDHKGPSLWKPKSAAARRAKLATKTSKLTQTSAIQVKSSEHQESHSSPKTTRAGCVDPQPGSEGEGPQGKGQDHRSCQKTGVKSDVHVAVADVASASAPSHKSQEQGLKNRSRLRAAAPVFEVAITVPPAGPCKTVDGEGPVASYLSAHASGKPCREGVGGCMSPIAPSETSKAGNVKEEVADSRKNESMIASGSLEQAHGLTLVHENGMAVSICAEAFHAGITPTERAMWVNGSKVEVKDAIFDASTTSVPADSELNFKEEGTGNPEIKSSGLQPGFTKPFRPRTAEEERFHQKVFRKYKVTGKWAPKPAQQDQGILDIVGASHGTRQGKLKSTCESLLTDITESRHESGQLEPKADDSLLGDIMENIENSQAGYEDPVAEIGGKGQQKKHEAPHGAPVAELMDSRSKGAHEAPLPHTMESSHETEQGKPEAAHDAPSDELKNHAVQGESQVPGTRNTESKANGWRPGFTKPFCPRTPGQERFHQKVFRKHKETGKWAPKANRQAAVRPDNADKQ